MPLLRRLPGAGEEPAVGGRRLADYAVFLWLHLVPEVVLHPSTAAWFTRALKGHEWCDGAAEPSPAAVMTWARGLAALPAA